MKIGNRLTFLHIGYSVDWISVLSYDVANKIQEIYMAKIMRELEFEIHNKLLSRLTRENR